jgi:Methyltransferase FkbM domain
MMTVQEFRRAVSSRKLLFVVRLVSSALPQSLKWGIKKSFIGKLVAILKELTWLRRGSFSNSGEDLVLVELLPEDSGHFIDVGSGRPISSNNTFKFYKKNWRGISIDPIHFNVSLSKFLRPSDRNMFGYVSGSGDVRTLYEFLPYQNSTLDHDLAMRQLNTVGFHLVRKIAVPRIDLNKLGIKMRPSEATLLTIDAEGMDFEILSSIDFDVIYPKVICVEAWGHSQESRIREFLHQKNYSLVCRRGDSLIFQFQID